MKIVTNMIEVHIVRKKENDFEFLLLKRSDKENYPGLWQMVSGKIKIKEKAYQTALREIKEETGIVPLKLWVVPNVNSFYSHHTDELNFIPVFAGLVDDSSEVKLSDEHSEFKWVRLEEAKELLAWKGQKNSVDIIYEYFTNNLSILNFTHIDF